MNNKNLFTFLLGAAAGAFTTWLLTSDEGKKLTSKLKEELNDLIKPESENNQSSAQEPTNHESRE